jgi:hypothetical protein
MAPLRFCLAVLLGFVLPGLAASQLLKSPVPVLATFVVSSVVLCHAVFWLGVLGIHISFVSVGLVLLLISAMLLGLTWEPLVASLQRLVATERTALLERTTPLERLAFVAVAAVTLLVVLRSSLQPLSGWDTPFRWNFLAVRLLELGRFDFYPPLKPQDFSIYFYVDGIPPLVSFSYFWLYASVGRPVALVTALLVTAQFLLLALVCHRLTTRLFSRQAAALALLALAASPLLFWSVVMGQETGLTALALGATVLFLVEAEDGEPMRRAVLAGFAAALGAWARDYGMAFILCGLLVCLWRRLSVRVTATFLLTGALLAAPWYVRNWLFTGNPFYSNAVGTLFPVNPVHAGIMAGYARQFSLSVNPSTKLIATVRCLGLTALVPILVGLAGCVRWPRRLWGVAVSVLLVALLWAYSVGQTAGGLGYSLRVLSPALVLLAVAAGGLLAHLAGNSRLRTRLVLVPVLALAVTSLLLDLLFPQFPWALPPSHWLSAAFGNLPTPMSAFADAPLPVAPGGRILSDNAYYHAALAPRGVDVVPVWSPEAAFLFDRRMTFTEARRRLEALGIRRVFVDPGSPNYLYLEAFPFFADIPKHTAGPQTGSGGALYRSPDQAAPQSEPRP